MDDVTIHVVCDVSHMDDVIIHVVCDVSHMDDVTIHVADVTKRDSAQDYIKNFSRRREKILHMDKGRSRSALGLVYGVYKVQ